MLAPWLAGPFLSAPPATSAALSPPCWLSISAFAALLLLSAAASLALARLGCFFAQLPAAGALLGLAEAAALGFCAVELLTAVFSSFI